MDWIIPWWKGAFWKSFVKNWEKEEITKATARTIIWQQSASVIHYYWCLGTFIRLPKWLGNYSRRRQSKFSFTRQIWENLATVLLAAIIEKATFMHLYRLFSFTSTGMWGTVCQYCIVHRSRPSTLLVWQMMHEILLYRNTCTNHKSIFILLRWLLYLCTTSSLWTVPY